MVEANGQIALASPEGWQVWLSPERAQVARRASTNAVILGARHSTIRLHKSAVPGAVAGQAYIVEPTGDVTFVQVKLGAAVVIVSVEPSVSVAPDEPVWIEFDQSKIHLFDGETQNALT
jgi:multiple sugar transport system ATP-binding protein